MFTNILCFKLGVSPVNLNICDLNEAERCRAKGNGKNPCGGACYKRNLLGEGIIMVRNPYNFPMRTLLHELFHHIDRENKSESISAIMYSWYEKMYKQKTGYRKFLRKAKQNGKTED